MYSLYTIGNSYTVFNNNSADHRGGSIYCNNNSRIHFQRNSSTVFSNNIAFDGGAIYSSYSNIYFQENSITVFKDNHANNEGGAIYCRYGYVSFEQNSLTSFGNNIADVGGAICSKYDNIYFKVNSSSTFSNNIAGIDGGAIYSYYSNIYFQENSITVFKDNPSNDDGGAMYSYNSHIFFQDNSVTTFKSNHANDKGGAAYYRYGYVSFEQNSSTVFNHNIGYDGAAIYSKYHYMYFKVNSSATFINNIAGDDGGSIYSYYAYIHFEGKSSTVFTNNSADDNGGSTYSKYGHMYFEEYSFTEFSNNTADEGGGIYSYDGHVTFADKSSVLFKNNNANYNGGAISSYYKSNISFKENSSTVFSHNAAKYGGAIRSHLECHISFNGNSYTLFSNNVAGNGGAVSSDTIYFKGNSFTMFSHNTAWVGGAIYSNLGHLTNANGHVSFNGSSSTVFSNNTAAYEHGGAIYTSNLLTFEGNSSTVFSYNFADEYGGAIYTSNLLTSEGNSSTMYSHNTAYAGGAIYTSNLLTFKGDSYTVFSYNTVRERIRFEDNGDGGAVFSHYLIYFDDSSLTVFSNNNAVYDGGAIITKNKNSHIYFKGNSSTKFSNNNARRGGALFSIGISFDDNSSAVFSNNIAEEGGAIIVGGLILTVVNMSFKGNSKSVFINNTAHIGGSIKCDTCYLHFDGTSKTFFSHNTAETDGGAIYSTHYMLFVGNSYTVFNNNIASKDGGAIYLKKRFQGFNKGTISFKENCSMVFSNNNADKNGGAIFTADNGSIFFTGYSTTVFRNNNANYGGAILARLNSSIIFSDDSTVTFTNNRATFGATVHSTTNSNIIAKQNCTLKFNNALAKWCSNACLHYTDQSDTVTIDRNGIVWCSNPNQFFCLMGTCFCNELEESLNTTVFQQTTVVKITDRLMTLSSAIDISAFINERFNDSNISMIGYNNPTVICVNGGRLKVRNNCTLIIEGITWIGCGGYGNTLTPVILIGIQYIDSIIIIQNCSFQHSISPAIGYLSNKRLNITVNHCNFLNGNSHVGQGVAIYFTLINSSVIINNCNFAYNGVAESIIYITTSAKVYINNSNFYNNQGVPVYLSDYSILQIHGRVLFENNLAKNGAAIYISEHSTIIFGNNSTTKFSYNNASNGTIHSVASSNVIFKGNCEVTFNNNLAIYYGAAIYSFDNSHITFTGKSKVKFINNVIFLSDIKQQLGGIIFSDTYSYLSFEDNSITVFSNNVADFGAAIYSLYNSNIIFKHNSWVKFNKNIARSCGTLTSALFSSITFNNNAEVTFSANTVLCTSNPHDESLAGAICTFTNTDVIFSGHSFITFSNNTAGRAGAVVIFESNVYVEEYSTVNFNSNSAQYSSGGAFECSKNSSVTIKDNSNVTFNNNKASQNGGAIYSYDICQIVFKGHSITKFVNNNARYNGGATLGSQLSTMIFEGNSSVNFDTNTADNGGVFYFNNSIIISKEKSFVLFCNNKALQNGGVGYFNLQTNVKFEGNTVVRFDNNRALFGGALFVTNHSIIMLIGNSNLSFVSNEASQSGGAGYFYTNCNFIMKDNALVTFNNNEALNGGAACVSDKTNIILEGSSTALFYYNLAAIGGGAVEVVNKSSISLKDDIHVNFTNNNAEYGGAIFLDKSAVMINTTNDEQSIFFKNNKAKFKGNSVYLDVTESCNSSCLNSKILNIESDFIITPPNALKFYNPAICIDNDNETPCNSYYVQNIMLGREIILPTCVLDYYNNLIVDSTQFMVYTEINSNYFINGPQDILISCNLFQGFHVMGNQIVSTSKNLSINISLNVDQNPDWKQITTALVIELSPCYLGFWQHPESQQCECYNVNDIVFCSSNSSTIKSGYWFGNVTGKPTITFCPINYCNFTCCETTNGYYHLSPVRDNQCRSHRSGTACGSCTHGYTLSFDSTECISLESCTVGQTILVIALTVVYWIVIFAGTFTMMYYGIGFGYLYSITYYYSIVDIILSQNLQANGGLYFVVSIISSFFKITPQFLGELCLTPGMSGIDQQFIHYIHPSAIILILVAIVLFARKSRRMSAIIGRVIIHVICLLLLLSYTSLASTSLLLIRALRFHEIDKIYSYLSPDIEYFHGRHLAYSIVSMLCIVSIVIGLPFLLIIHPFINHKINFTRIKPLLDDFQGCYKDKYRCFAAYYMICRLMIITIIVVNSSNDFITSYMLNIVTGITTLTHLIVMPYNKNILNKFDGILLQIINCNTALPLLSDDFTSPLAISLCYVLIFFPLLSFITLELFLHKDNIKKLIAHYIFKDKSLSSTNEVNKNDVPMREFDNIIDDGVRVNFTARDM